MGVVQGLKQEVVVCRPVGLGWLHMYDVHSRHGVLQPVGYRQPFGQHNCRSFSVLAILGPPARNAVGECEASFV